MLRNLFTLLIVFFFACLPILKASPVQDNGVEENPYGIIDWRNRTVTATGVGAPPENSVLNEGCQFAHLAAVIVAQRNLLAAVRGVEVDSLTTASMNNRDSYSIVEDTINSRTGGKLRGARIIKEENLPGKLVRVTLLIGIDDLIGVAPAMQTRISAVAPDRELKNKRASQPPYHIEGKDNRDIAYGKESDELQKNDETDRELSERSSSDPEEKKFSVYHDPNVMNLKPEPGSQVFEYKKSREPDNETEPGIEKELTERLYSGITPAPALKPLADNTAPGRKLIPPRETLKEIPNETATGLIIDARDLDARPSLTAAIEDENGREVYGSAYFSHDYVLEQGMAGYAKDLESASSNSRVTDNPIIVNALKAIGPGNSDLVISNEDAEMIRNITGKLSFLEKGRVMIVVN